MHYVRILGAFAFVSVAILAAPTYGASQTTTDRIEQKVKSAAQDVRAEAADSWLTAKTMIALYADERVKGRQISVETVKGTVVRQRSIDVGDLLGNDYVVKSGLSPGDRLIVSGIQKIGDGAPVKPE